MHFYIGSLIWKNEMWEVGVRSAYGQTHPKNEFKGINLFILRAKKETPFR